MNSSSFSDNTHNNTLIYGILGITTRIDIPNKIPMKFCTVAHSLHIFLYSDICFLYRNCYNNIIQILLGLNGFEAVLKMISGFPLKVTYRPSQISRGPYLCQNFKFNAFSIL